MYECDFGEIILQIILEVDENILSLHRKIATGSVGRAVRQRSAKPCTAVQICYRPQKKVSEKDAFFFCYAARLLSIFIFKTSLVFSIITFREVILQK